ncbi:uncharacterized protein LOC110666140 isoform X7 [Hevea brasiliensis]|uniref:uncharacterized protein LOC110666140 isoform X7 n=1 Tax=Hevea brasiliensis TaxID=3981 RepID=UPI0025D124C2|nr:uncharacterized protein LOC110666140 isoform X7 [Hevea brasiliensis]
MALTQNPKPTTILISSVSNHFYPATSLTLPNPLRTKTNSQFFGAIPSSIHNLQQPLPIFSRRLFLPAVSGIWDAVTGGNNAREAVVAIRRGMLLFRQGDVLGSLAEFDKAIELDPRQKAYLKKGQSSFDSMLPKIQTTQRSQYGAFFVKLSCMELMMQGSNFLRLAEIHDLSCGRLITCLKMVVIQKSLSRHFQMAQIMNISMLLYMLGYIMNPRINQMQPNLI